MDGLAVSNAHGDVVQLSSVVYADRWSLPGTWPRQLLPAAGQDVFVPRGRRIIVDVASTPIYNTVTVEGALLFDDALDITFSARQIIVRNGGLLEGGTPEAPRSKGLRVVLCGRRADGERGGRASKSILVQGGRVSLAG